MKKRCESANVAVAEAFPRYLRRMFARVYYTLEKDMSRLAGILAHSNVNTIWIYTVESGGIHARRMERVGRG